MPVIWPGPRRTMLTTRASAVPIPREPDRGKSSSSRTEHPPRWEIVHAVDSRGGRGGGGGGERLRVAVDGDRLVDGPRHPHTTERRHPMTPLEDPQHHDRPRGDPLVGQDAGAVVKVR